MKYASTSEMKQALASSARLDGGRLQVTDAEAFRTQCMDRLVWTAVFGDDTTRPISRWIIWEASQQLGCPSASIQGLYEAAGRENVLAGRTVPAMNLRGMTYEQARCVFRAAMKGRVGAAILELARSEIGYTFQRPGEYASVILAAAIREGFRGPVFIQGDHYQINRKGYAKDPEAELAGLYKLIVEALDAGYGNIDIDASTLVDINKPTLREQQELNSRYTAEATRFIREHQPAGVMVSVGGEIGEVGGHNSTVDELRAFMDSYWEKLGLGTVGISKISVQTGTSHGGVVLPDGTIAMVELDFPRLAELSSVAREWYHLAGAVQHGASTLPEEAFDQFPKAGAAEVHLATGFQNITFDHPTFPRELRDRMYAYLREKFASERKPNDTDEQFYYSNRKRVWGPFKLELWSLPDDVRHAINVDLEAQFAKLFRKLGVEDSTDLVNSYVKPAEQHRPAPARL